MEDLELFHRYKQEAENEVCIVYFLHGLGDHIGRWDDLKNFFINRQISFYGHDQRGHGRTTLGIQAYIEDFNTFVDDTAREIECIKKDKPDIPIIIMGHSMGGLISVMTALKRPDLLAGALLSAPLLKLSDNVSPFMKKLAWGLSSLFPRLYMPWNSMDRSTLTPNLEQLAKDADDPLIWHSGVRAGFAVQMFKAIEQTEKRHSEYSVPTFILHSEFDKVCDYAGSVKFAQANPELVKVLRYDHPYHSLLHLMPQDSEVVMKDALEKILELIEMSKTK